MIKYELLEMRSGKPFDITRTLEWKIFKFGQIMGVSPFSADWQGIHFKWTSKQTVYFFFILCLSLAMLGYFIQMAVTILIRYNRGLITTALTLFLANHSLFLFARCCSPT